MVVVAVDVVVCSSGADVTMAVVIVVAPEDVVSGWTVVSG